MRIIKLAVGSDTVNHKGIIMNFRGWKRNWMVGVVLALSLAGQAYAQDQPAAPEKKVKALAVLSDARYKHEPNVPSMKEALPDFQTLTSWWGLLAPANLPRPLAERISTEVRNALNDPESVSKLDPLGIVNVGSTPEKFSAFLKEEID